MVSTGSIAHHAGVVGWEEPGSRRHERAGARFRGLLDALPDAVLVVDPDGRIALANHRAEELFSVARDEFVSIALDDVLDSEAPKTRLSWREGRRADGSTFPAELSVSEFDDGDEVLTIMTIRDVTAVRSSELALAESEQHLREAQAVAHVGSWHWDIASGANTWSEELYRIFGLSPTSFTPTFDGYVAHVHPDDREANLAHIQGTLERDEPYDHEYRVVRPSGEVRWLFTQGAVERDDDGAPAAMRGTCSDVTERHEAEERYRAVSELTSDVAFAFHVGTDGTAEVDWVTGGHERLTGYTIEETHAIGWRNLIHPLDRPDYEERISALAEGESGQAEVRVSCKNGDVRWTRIHVRRVPAAPGTLRFFGAVQDLTAQTQAERRLLESEERYRSISELSTDVAYSYHLDADGRVVLDWVTDGIERITGYTPAEAAALNGWRGMVIPEERDAYERRLDRLLAGEPVTEEFRIRTKQGEIRWVEISTRPQQTAEGLVRVVGAARDVTDRKEFEEALAASEAMLREAHAVAGLGSWAVVDGALTWSDQMYEIHGFDQRPTFEILEDYLAYVHPDDHDAVSAAVYGLMSGVGAYDLEYRIVRPDGGVRWAHARGVPTFAPDGRLVGMRGTVLDVTGRKGAVLALAESERRLKEAQAAAHIGHYRRDLRTTEIEWSDEMYRIAGVDREHFDLTVEAILDGAHPDDREIFLRGAQTTLSEGAAEYEFRIMRGDGEVRWLHMRSRLEHDAEGTPVAIVGVTQDITERRQAEDLHRVVSEMVSDILYSYQVTDGHMSLQWVTPAFERVTGYRIDSPLPIELFRPVTHPDDIHLIEEAEERVLAGEFHVAEIRVVTRDEQVRWLRLYAQPVRDDASGDVVRVYGAAQDVTAHREADEALRGAYERERNAAARLREADRMKDEFLSTASHELRTPLTAIVGFASALSRGAQLDDETRADITLRLERNALAVGTMVERLLDFSRLEAGAVTLDAQEVDVSEIASRTVDILAPELDWRRVRIDVPPGMIVHADPTGLTHVFSNLLSNAAKYTPESSIVRVAAESTNGTATITVTDDGPGMRPDVLSRVFDRFFRGPDQPTGQRGTGIGLAIARAYTEMMGGRIWVESTVGVGTRFFFTLPVAPPDPVQRLVEAPITEQAPVGSESAAPR